MKEIVIIRHAKSSWEYDYKDIDRPLKNRGITDAGLVSKEFLLFKYKPEFVFSSPAKRAVETCNIFVRNINISNNIVRFHDQLYDFGGDKVVDFIKSMDNTYNKVMIFGHNHALTSIVNLFGDQYIDNLPTCGLVVLEFDIDNWKDVDQGHIVKTIFPRDLK